MIVKVGSNLCLAIAAMLFAASTFCTVGFAGPVAIAACDDACCTTNAATCKGAAAPCNVTACDKTCNRGGGVVNCY